MAGHPLFGPKRGVRGHCTRRTEFGVSSRCLHVGLDRFVPVVDTCTLGEQCLGPLRVLRVADVDPPAVRVLAGFGCRSHNRVRSGGNPADGRPNRPGHTASTEDARFSTVPTPSRLLRVSAGPHTCNRLILPAVGLPTVPSPPSRGSLLSVTVAGIGRAPGTQSSPTHSQHHSSP